MRTILRSLLTGAIDYAGLFPPAGLSMSEAVDEYARHRRAPDRWALGRFVAPLSRWDELDACVRRTQTPGGAWPVSLLAAPADYDTIQVLRGSANAVLLIEAVECRAAGEQDVLQAAVLTQLGLDVFVEAEKALSDLDGFAQAVRRIGAAAKIRTGGVTTDVFPDPHYVLAFLRACRRAQVRFKATAGLHHAIRGDYKLTYATDSATGVMFGFLNIAIAAALVWADRSDGVVLGVLDERSPAAFELTDAGVLWRGEFLSRSELDAARFRFFAGFGSCSFREPMVEVGLDAVPVS